MLWTYYVSVSLDVCHASFSTVDRNFGFQLQNASTVVDSNYYLFIKIISTILARAWALASCVRQQCDGGLSISLRATQSWLAI